MNIILALLFFLSSNVEQQNDVSEIRRLYKDAAEKEIAVKKLLETTQDKTVEDPLLLGYNAVAHMLMAKHVGNPFKKLSYFNKGKDIFSQAIETDPNNVELRFLRFSVQAETPAFLNYKQNLEEDKKILLARTPELKDAELKRMIQNYLSVSKALSETEKEMIN